MFLRACNKNKLHRRIYVLVLTSIYADVKQKQCFSHITIAMITESLKHFTRSTGRHKNHSHGRVQE